MDYNDNDMAVANAPSRKLFAPIFTARWQNMQNIVNNTTFLSMIPAGYKTYYTAYIKQWLEWAQGFVPQLHKCDFFSSGMGYTVCDIFAKECMSGGYRFTSADPQEKDFITQWDDDRLNDVFNKMFFYANAGGNAILALTPVYGELYADVYPIDRVVFRVDRRGEITQAMLLNRFIAGETAYYVRELRVKHCGKFYYEAQLAAGLHAMAPVWSDGGMKDVPIEIEEEWKNTYGNIRPGRWYELPKRMRSIGLYNVRNKSVAVALKDLPGYSDSTLHTALDVLYSIDYNFTQAQVDMYLGKGRVIIPKQMRSVHVDQPGVLADGKTFREAVGDINGAPLEEVFFSEIPDKNLNGDSVKPTFMQPDMRGEAHKFIRDADLELLASKVGLSSSDLANHLTYNASKTATEVVSEQDTTETSVNNKRALANIAINNMLADVAYFYGYTGEISIEWGRAAANSSRENAELLADYQANTLPLRDYLRKRWPDLSEAEVEDMEARVKAENSERQREQQANNGLFDDVYGGMSDGRVTEHADGSLGRGGNEDTANS